MSSKVNVGDILGKAAKKSKKSSSKSNTPEVELSELDEAISDWKTASKAEKNAKADKARIELTLLAKAEEERLKVCQSEKTFHSSIRLNGQVVVSVQNKYKKIDTDDYGDLEKIFGGDTDALFIAKTTIALSPAALADEEIVAKLIKAVGEENFGRYFEVDQQLVPTERLHHERATDPVVAEQFEKAKEEGLIAPYKAAIKQA